MRYAYAVTTWSGAKLAETIHSIPRGSRLLVIDNSQLAWPLAKSWNYAIDRLCIREGFDAVIVCNDDIVLRPDTGDLLARGLLQEQYTRGISPELLLVSARHAAPTDARTDEVDRKLLKEAVPRWQPGPDFACFCTSRKLLETVGPFDEGFTPGHFEDNDMHRRVLLAGYEGMALAPYWHFLNGTTRSDPERRAVVEATFDVCRRRYCEKWGAPYDDQIPIGRETYTSPWNGGPAR